MAPRHVTCVDISQDNGDRRPGADLRSGTRPGRSASCAGGTYWTTPGLTDRPGRAYGKAHGRSVGQSVSRSVGRSIDRSASRSVDLDVGRSVGQSIGR